MNHDVEVKDLHVVLSDTGIDIANKISFSITAGEVLGLVGESGSGKTTVGTAMLAFVRRGAKISGGSVVIKGAEILTASETTLCDLRGKVVAYVPQDPATALSPSLRISMQLEELLLQHEPGLDKSSRRDRISNVLKEVDLPATLEFLNRYPHQLSGGQQQRICLAMAFLMRPALIVMDEPTTGLDVTTQAHVLRTVRQLCKIHNVAALYVTHDLAVVANLADRVLVMYAGRIAEVGQTRQVFGAPAHPYTHKLLDAIPEISRRRDLSAIPGHAPSPSARGVGCHFAPRCMMALDSCRIEEPPARSVSTGHVAYCHRAGETFQQDEPSPSKARPVVTAPSPSTALALTNVRASYGSVQILQGISFEIAQKECLALVGGSGSGKSTLARAIIGLMGTWTGEIRLNGDILAHKARARPEGQRKTLQYIFQNPYSSLNPRKTIQQTLETPLRQLFDVTGVEARKRAQVALERVHLSPQLLQHYPDQLSGGERQRVAIARALVCRPSVLICDEVTSALDVSVQAAIVNLLKELQATDGLSILFITHNLALVRSMADRVIVMNKGRIVEGGDTDSVLFKPVDQYTRSLIGDTPGIISVART